MRDVGATAPGSAFQSGAAPQAGPGRPADRTQLQQLLDAATAARRQLDVQVAEAEAGLAEREAALVVVRAAVTEAEGTLGPLQETAAVASAGAALARDKLDAASRTEASAVAAAGADRTPRAFPPAAGYSAKDEAARARRAMEQARRDRDVASAALYQAQRDLQAGQERLATALRQAGELAEEVEQRRGALDGLRQQLAAAVASGTTTAAWVAHALSAETAVVAQPSPLALADIPADYLDRYRRHAASCPGMSWAVLAAVGSIETSHGRSNAPGSKTGANPAGAMGPMQFLAPTWDSYGVDGNGDGKKDVYDPDDAVAGAANYLCASGAGRLASLASAIWNYNHAAWYVASVIELAAAYGAGDRPAATAPLTPAQLVDHPNLTLTAQARADVLAGRADRRLLQLLAATVPFHRIAVSVVKTGHDQFVRGTDRVSNHYVCDGCVGRAMDISAVDGAAVSATNVAALELALSMLTADPAVRPDEFGSPWPDLALFPGGFTDGDHQDHLHVAWRS